MQRRLAIRLHCAEVPFRILCSYTHALLDYNNYSVKLHCVCVCVKSSSHTILLGEMLSNCVRGARDRWRETKASGHLTPETTSGHLRVVEKSDGVMGEGVG